jgi:plasmid maintenance system killer protein
MLLPQSILAEFNNTDDNIDVQVLDSNYFNKLNFNLFVNFISIIINNQFNILFNFNLLYLINVLILNIFVYI